MSTFELAGLLLTAIAVFGYINHRFIKLPDTLGITAVGMLASLLMLAYGNYDPASMAAAKEVVKSLDFADLVFHGFLGFLLFSGALHVDIAALKEQKLPVFLLTTFGVMLSIAIVGVTLHLVLAWLDIKLALLWCLAFGAIISPTDPVAVLSVLKTAGLPVALKNKIAGEALFNDATAVVAFVTLVGLASGTITDVSTRGLVTRLAHEIIGALVMGGGLGFGVNWMLQKIDSHAIEIFLTLALATAGYSLCEYVHVSAPLAVVIMGLVIGSQGFGLYGDEKSKVNLFNFWELLDELLNLILFGLIGVLVLTITFNVKHFAIGLVTILLVLVARYISVGVPLGAIRSSAKQSALRAKILTWGGLRGGASIALALSLPPFPGRDLIQTITYIVVAFSLLVQATTLGSLVSKWLEKCPDDTSPCSGSLIQLKRNKK